MAIGRAGRRKLQEPRVVAQFPGHVATVMQILDLLDLAWHDCYGEATPPDSVMDDVFDAAQGDIVRFIDCVHLAVQDSRDLRLQADQSRT